MQSPKAFMLTAHGTKMPAIGFGTVELPHRPAELVAAAIASGYRHIDTARKYGTEERVGEGICASGPGPELLEDFNPPTPLWLRAKLGRKKVLEFCGFQRVRLTRSTGLNR